MKLLDVGEVAALLGVSALRVRQLANDGRLPVAVRTARGRRLFDPVAVAALATPTGARGLGAILAVSVGASSRAPVRSTGRGESRDKVAIATQASPFEDECEIVRRFLSLFGIEAPCLSDPNAGASADSGADVMLRRGGERIGYQVTEYHGGETPGARGGSALRREESRRARNARPYPMCGIARPLQGLVTRISSKVEQSAKYDFKEFHGVNLLVASGVPRWGALGSTLLLESFLDVEALERLTAPMLSRSRYASAYIFNMLSVSGRSAVFTWDRSAGWRRLV